MQYAPKIIIALIIAAGFAACTSGGGNANTNAAAVETNANSNSASAVKDNIDELEMTIKMPFHPEEAVWREDVQGKNADSRVPGPTDKKLLAVLKFLKDDADKVTAQAEKYKPAATETVTTEKWFPAELIAQSQTSGNDTLKGASYPANDFYNPPYSTGKITRIEGTDYFVLELYSK